MNEDSREAWAKTAVELVNKAVPFEDDDVRTLQTRSKLLPHAISVVDHAAPLGVAQDSCSRLFNHSGLYLNGRAEFDRATRLSNLGNVLQDLGDRQGAKRIQKRALDVFREFLGDNHSSTVIVRNNLALLRDNIK
jgi:hypothetical protein